MRTPAPRAARTARWQGRVTAAGLLVLGAFLLLASVWGVVETWRVAAAFRAGGPTVDWQDGPDLVVMAAPLVSAAASFGWPGVSARHPLLSCGGYAALTLLVGAGLGMADASLLDRIAAANGFHHCGTLDVWDPHGGRGGGPVLRSWGYSRTACPAVPEAGGPDGS